MDRRGAGSRFSRLPSGSSGDIRPNHDSSGRFPRGDGTISRLGEMVGMAAAMRRIAVIVFQLGGPDTLEAIEPFLFNLFCDPDIIDFPGARIGRRPLAKLISSTRAKKVQHHYAVIGGGSPIRRFTEQQARALELCLLEAGVNARCFVAMRYWHPFTAEAIEQLKAADCDRSEERRVGKEG